MNTLQMDIFCSKLMVMLVFQLQVCHCEKTNHTQDINNYLKLHFLFIIAIRL